MISTGFGGKLKGIRLEILPASALELEDIRFMLTEADS